MYYDVLLHSAMKEKLVFYKTTFLRTCPICPSCILVNEINVEKKLLSLKVNKTASSLAAPQLEITLQIK